MVSAILRSQEDTGTDLDHYLRDSRIDISMLAHTYANGVATYRIETRQQLLLLLEYVAPALQSKGVKVSIRTNSEELKDIVRSRGERQTIGSRPDFLVQGRPTDGVASHQRATSLTINSANRQLVREFEHGEAAKKLSASEVASIKTIPAAGLDVQSLRTWLAAGNQAKIRVENVRDVPMETWIALRAMQRQFGNDQLKLDAVQREGENIRAIWQRAGEVLGPKQEVVAAPVRTATPVSSTASRVPSLTSAYTAMRNWLGGVATKAKSWLPTWGRQQTETAEAGA